MSLELRAQLSEGPESIIIFPDPLDLEAAKEWIQASNAPGRIFTVLIKRWYKKRTLNQNGWFHKIIGVMAIHENMQMSESEIKSGIKWVAADTHGYPKESNSISGRREPKPSSKASTIEFGILLDTCFEVAGEYGIDTVAQLYKEYLIWKEDQKGRQNED